MTWLVLVVAGLLEVGWALMLPETKGFSRLMPTLAFLGLLALSMLGLSYATRTLPIGTAYAVWVGIGAVGTVLFGILVQGNQTSPASLAALAALVASLVAVNLTSAH